MPPRSKARDVAVQACKDNPDLPNRTMARQLFRDQPKLFASLNSARDMVRDIRGNRGPKNRHNADVPRPNGKAGEIPKGRKQSRQPVRVPSGKVLVMSDLHCPYHNERAIKRAVEYGLEAGCDTLFLNGDVIDFYSISRWETDPRERNLPREIETTKKLLGWMGAEFRHKFYKAGNHDERYDKYISSRAEALVGVEGFSLQEVLQLKYYGYQFVHGRQLAYFGKLPIIHGHEGKIGSPVNPARGLWLKLNEPAMCSHLHTSSSHSQNAAISKHSKSTWSLGCMCELSPDYAMLAMWNIGFAIVTHTSRKYQVENYKMDPKAKEIWRA